MRLLWVALAALTLSLAAAGCTGPAAAGATGAARPLTVFAAASLRGAFTEIGAAHTAATGVVVRFSFDGSATLVDQLAGGAPADVLATADEPTMGRALEEGLIAGSPKVIAGNVATLVVPPGNPAKVTGLDGSLGGVRLVVCAPQVPCGSATRSLADRAGVTLSPVSEETSVSAVLAAVTSGEADAGVVYATDAAAAGDDVQAIAIAGAEEVVNRYPIAVTADAAEPDAAVSFLDRVGSDEGDAVLARYGFRTP